jgi:tetratricopeptide (TPR) repeat protein
MRPCNLLWQILLTALFVSPLGCQEAKNVTVAFEQRLPSPQDLTDLAAQERKDLAGFVPAGNAQTLVEAFVRLNKATVITNDDSEELESAMRVLEAAAAKMLKEDGPGTAKKVCLWLLRRFEDDLKELSRACTGVSGATAALLQGRPPAKALEAPYGKFAASGGDFLRHASRAGLITAGKTGGLNLEPGVTFFMRLAFKVRYANLFPLTGLSPSWLLSEFEQNWYDIWVVERSLTASLARKLGAIERLKERDPKYKDMKARGIVFFQKGDYAEALKNFERALILHPSDKRTKTFMEQAKRMLTR